VKREDFSDAVLLLLGHGSTQNPYSGATVFQHAAELRRRRVFSQVREGFWKQEPRAVQVLSELTERRIFIVPFFISAGYFSEEVIPRALGFLRGAEGGDPRGSEPSGLVSDSSELVAPAPAERVRRQGTQVLTYCRSVGSHETMTKVLLVRAREVVQRFPFPRSPKPNEITLFIAGHGTEQNENSRKIVERQVELIQMEQIYAGVHAVFMEEEPRIPTCYQTAQTKNIVVVPFFISDGLHVREDIPVLLGEPERIVQQRLQKGQPTWRNPSEKQGKLVWFAPSVGTEPTLTEVILERVREAAGWAG
jgi:sirohydrochlorin cobaltochelatase